MPEIVFSLAVQQAAFGNKQLLPMFTFNAAIDCNLGKRQTGQNKPCTQLPPLSYSTECGVLIACVFKARAKLVFVFGKWGKGS